MWVSTVTILSFLSFVHTSFSENPQEVKHCHDKSSGYESCSSTEEYSSDSSSDVASTIIRDLYKTISKAEQDLANPEDYPPDYRPLEGEEFDFIVVGAGSAGAVVANRLSEVSSWRVLLVEAGGNPTKSSELPGLAPTLQSTDIDWQFRSDPEENACLGMVNNSCKWPRGKLLGGSSTVNFMMYVRGNAKDYDNWAAAGNTGWSYKDVLPYFKKSEDMRVKDVLQMSDWDEYHGKDGYLSIEPWTYSNTDPLMDIVGKSFEELGYPFNTDYNGKKHSGFTRFHGTLKNHKRCSTAKAFLSPIKDRKNLKVAKHSLITKLLIDRESSSVFGVEFINKEGKTVHVHSKKEVILSAGTINSPQILMLSGIGPKKNLHRFGLPVIKDLPVGENLQDHLLMNSLVVTVNYSVPLPDMTRGMFEFATRGTGQLTNMGATSYAAFVKLNKSDVGDFPDMEFIPVHFSKNDEDSVRGFLSTFGYKNEVLSEFVEINKVGDSLLLLGSMLRPFSRGKVTLMDTDPKTHPNILSGTLSDNRDINLFLRTYSFMERLVGTESLRGLDAKLHEVRVAGCKKHSMQSRGYRECALRHLTATTYHYCGTCKMGPPSDPGAVVDPSLRVFGVKGLRVADASVIPTIVSGNINAAVIMVGEKAADLIKQAWQKREEL